MIRHSERLPQPALTGGLRTMTLPDGRQVLTLCGDNTRIAYDEIFVEQIYAMFGVDLPEGATVFDVGANVGLAVLWVGDRISQGTVHAFEPIPATFAALRANVARHSRLDVRLHHAGASNREGTAEFTFYPLTSTSSSMYPDDSPVAHEESNRFILGEIKRRLGPAVDLFPRWVSLGCAEVIRRWFQRSKRVACRLVRLSDSIRAAGVEQIDLLKLDVEGAEFDALAGIDDVHWPLIRQAIVEVHDGVESCQRMEQLLVERGFATHRYQQAPEVFARHWLIYGRRPAATRV
ncbi:MAG: FkbM family methyltransferase [Planctomycetota bacterium]|nr:MAG: FkbM family methyltransferase [Planctomycetota bacterium]